MNTPAPTTVAALLGAAADDERALWSIVALLAVVGVAMVMAAIAVIKATRPDRELLAPLEVMGRRKWRRSDPVWQRRQLDEVRPADARPLTPAPATPVPVEGFEEGPAAGGFADLTDLDSGIDEALTELPGGVVFDSDPTPQSGEVPIVRASAPSDDASLGYMAANWSSPPADGVIVPADPDDTQALADPDPDPWGQTPRGLTPSTGPLVVSSDDVDEQATDLDDTLALEDPDADTRGQTPGGLTPSSDAVVESSDVAEEQETDPDDLLALADPDAEVRGQTPRGLTPSSGSVVDSDTRGLTPSSDPIADSTDPDAPDEGPGDSSEKPAG